MQDGSLKQSYILCVSDCLYILYSLRRHHVYTEGVKVEKQEKTCEISAICIEKLSNKSRYRQLETRYPTLASINLSRNDTDSSVSEPEIQGVSQRWHPGEKTTYVSKLREMVQSDATVG